MVGYRLQHSGGRKSGGGTAVAVAGSGVLLGAAGVMGYAAYSDENRKVCFIFIDVH